MAETARKRTRPASLRKRVKVFDVEEGPQPGVFVRDEVLDESHTFEYWQFFVLESLFACDDFAKLSAAFRERYGKPLQEQELAAVFDVVEEHKWFSLTAAEHPLVVAHRKRKEGADPRVVEAALAGSNGAKASSNGADPQAKEKPLPPGVFEALGLDDATKKRVWKLFDPRPLLKLTTPLLWPLRHTLYVLPILVAVGIGLVVNYAGELSQDFGTRRHDVPVLAQLLIGMVTANLLAMWTMAVVAHRYRATVDAFGIVLHFYVFPRFIARIGHVRQLSRRERIWLHAAPILTRLTLFNLGVLLWFGFRTTHSVPSSFGLALMVACTFSLAITANPLIKSNAYHLLCAFLDEPALRGKSVRALLNRLKGTSYQKADRKALAAYALASGVFLLIALVAVVCVLDAYFEFYLGGPGIVALAIVTAMMIGGLVTKFKALNESYKKTAQFDAWRERVLPEGVTLAEPERSSRFAAYTLRAGVLAAVAVMFLPYTYEVGGPCAVLPVQTQSVASPISGTIEEIHYDGGEVLAAGTVIGRLSYADDEVQVKTLDARIAEQEAVIAELRSRPRPEEVEVARQALATEEVRARVAKEKLDRMLAEQAEVVAEVALAQRKVELAESALKTARTRALFSAEKLARTESLYAQDAVALEDLEEARREAEMDADRVEEARVNVEVTKADLELVQDETSDELEDLKLEYDVALQRVEEARATLALVELGAKPEEIAAAEAKLQGWKDERQYHLDRIEQSYYRMPFEGTLVATRLKEKVGSYVDRGEVLALAERSSQMIVQIDVPEEEVGELHRGAPVRGRLPAYFDEEFVGTVTSIDTTVTEEGEAAFVRVTALVENPDGRLKTGMTGYAKAESEVQRVWEVLARGVVRFFKVEMWSWIP